MILQLNLLENSIILTAVVNINVRQDSHQDDLKRNVLQETNFRLGKFHVIILVLIQFYHLHINIVHLFWKK